MQKSVIAITGVLLASLLVAPATTGTSSAEAGPVVQAAPLDPTPVPDETSADETDAGDDAVTDETDADETDADEAGAGETETHEPGTPEDETTPPEEQTPPPGNEETPGHDGPVRIMFVGDSLVHGQTATNTARFWVWRELRRNRVEATFVGPTNHLAKAYGRSIYNRPRQGFQLQTAHAAQAGTRFRYHLPRVQDLVANHQPDVIVLQLGFNDARRHGPHRIFRDTRRFINLAQAKRPGVRFVIGQIPLTTQPRLRRTINPTARRANRKIMNKLGSDPAIAIARTQTAKDPLWHPRIHTFDGIHANAVGETLLAQRYAEGLHQLEVLPTTPLIHRRVAWRPAIRPRVRAGRGFIRVGIRHARLMAYARSAKVVVRGRNGVVRRTRHLSRRAVRFNVPRGRYRVRMQLARGTMLGVTGITRVRVR